MRFRLDFACGCFALVYAREDQQGVSGGLACCTVHDRPGQTINGILALGAKLVIAEFGKASAA